MNRFVIPAIGILTVLTAGTAFAQPQAPVMNRSPGFSPYLNLLRGGNPAINYYGLVRPQIAFAQQATQLQQQVNQNYQSLQTLQSIGPSNLAAQQPLLPYTGHPVVFNSLGGFFNNLPVGGGAGGGRTGLGGSPAFVNPLGLGVPGAAISTGVPSTTTTGSMYNGSTPGFVPRSATTNEPKGPTSGPAPKN